MPQLMEAVVLRPADPRDTDAIVAMSTGPIAGKRAFITTAFDRRTVITAWVAGRMAGYIIWDRSFFSRPFVWLLGVDPAFRRRGIGKQLMREFADRCVGEGLFTSTNESNDGMQALLAGLGFVLSGRVENLDPGDPELFFFKAAVDG